MSPGILVKISRQQDGEVLFIDHRGDPRQKETCPGGAWDEPTPQEGEKKMITFTIDLLPEEISGLRTLLEARGVRFDPERQVIAFNNDALDKAVAMGHHLPGMLEGRQPEPRRRGADPPGPN